jgi:hypothetical protein
MADCLRPLDGVVKVGFQTRKKGLTPNNAAASYNLEHAITGTYPNFVVDYPEVIYSRGNLLEAANAEVATLVPAELGITWKNDAPVSGTGGSDKATIVVIVRRRTGLRLPRTLLPGVPWRIPWKCLQTLAETRFTSGSAL